MNIALTKLGKGKKIVITSLAFALALMTGSGNVAYAQSAKNAVQARNMTLVPWYLGRLATGAG